MKVRDLKKILENIDDNLDVVIYDEDTGYYHNTNECGVKEVRKIECDRGYILCDDIKSFDRRDIIDVLFLE